MQSTNILSFPIYFKIFSILTSKVWGLGVIITTPMIWPEHLLNFVGGEMVYLPPLLTIMLTQAVGWLNITPFNM